MSDRRIVWANGGECRLLGDDGERFRGPGRCTGDAASWCPVCGDCTCPREENGEPVVYPASAWPRMVRRALVLPEEDVVRLEVQHDRRCPLHGVDARHNVGGPA